MEWPVELAKNADLELRAANYPDLRLLTVPRLGTQQPQTDFEARWRRADPESVRDRAFGGWSAETAS